MRNGMAIGGKVPTTGRKNLSKSAIKGSSEKWIIFCRFEGVSLAIFIFRSLL